MTGSDSEALQLETVGRYELVARIADGGMAELHLGRLSGPAGFSQYVAVKRILPHLARDESFVAMFLDEAKIAAHIRHPNVVSVWELGQDGGQLFLAMEYLVGEPLHRLLSRLRARRTPMPPALAAHVTMEVCKGLHAAHETTGSDGARMGIVHRDVSPQNVLITFDGVVKVLDFGIAKAADRLTKTDTGTFKGKLGYAAPEHIEGLEMDRRSDVFSIGVLLFETLTGTRLFRRENAAQTMRATLAGAKTVPSQLRPELGTRFDAIFLKAVALDPNDRFPSADAMRVALAAVSDSSGAAELGAYMQTELADALVVHEDRLERARALPTVTRELVTETGSPDAPRRRRGVALALVSFALALGVLVGAMRWTDEPTAEGSDAKMSARAAPAVRTVEGEDPPRASPAPMAVANVDSPLRLRIVSVPAGAEVRVDDERVGVTPLTIEHTSGVVDVRLSRRGYLPRRDQLELRRDMTHEVRLRRRVRMDTRDEGPEYQRW